ncbi:hypothetical protein PN432_16090, partial [Microcystis aeruginosa CS-579]|nr:hypothetical protein [Microcystis aeruginosa CS-579]
GINLGEDSVLGFHLVGILAFSLSTQIFFFLATLVLSGFDPLVSVSQASNCSIKLIYASARCSFIVCTVIDVIM